MLDVHDMRNNDRLQLAPCGHTVRRLIAGQCQACYHNAWRRAHREASNLHRQRWADKNRDHLREYYRNYRHTHSARLNEQARQRYRNAPPK